MGKSTKENFEYQAKLLRTLGHPVRLEIIEELKNRPWCVCELASKLGLNNPTASKHLSLLKSVGVISMERKSTQVICTLIKPCVLQIIHCATDADIKNSTKENLDSSKCLNNILK